MVGLGGRRAGCDGLSAGSGQVPEKFFPKWTEGCADFAPRVRAAPLPPFSFSLAVKAQFRQSQSVRTGAPGIGPETPRGVFATTHWSVVLAAGQKGTPQSASALEILCRTYWYPVYAHVRQRGYAPEDAQDLTQQFFAHFLEKGSFDQADPARGRFRSFLLKSLQHFLTDDWKRAHRAKRGGGAFRIPLGSAAAEARLAAELTEKMTPERAYEERWAMTMLERVLDQMREDHIRTGKQRLFDTLQDLLWDSRPPVACASLAKDLGLTEAALYAAVHRLREDYRERLRAEVAQTVDQPEQVDDELRYLIRVVGAAN